MKRPTFSDFIRSSSLIFDLLFFAIAVSFLAQTNLVQTSTLHLSAQSTPLQASKLENTDNLGWSVFTGLAVLAGLVGLATLEHKQRTANSTLR